MASRSRWAAVLIGAAVATPAAAAAGRVSSALADAQLCMARSGLLDLYSSQKRCLLPPARCPHGADRAYLSCVAHELPGPAKEVAVTLHMPCSSCTVDGGMDLAGALWIAVVHLLHVPLQETGAGILVVDPRLREQHPLEHFTLRKGNEAPLVSRSIDPGQSVAGTWDLFVAIRIHTARIVDSSVALATLRNHNAGPLQNVLGAAGAVSIFEFEEQSHPWVRSLADVHAVYKVRGHDWNERPSGSTSGRTPTPAPVCPCASAYVGNGNCESPCNIGACSFDGGDCASMGPSPTPVPSPRPTPRPTPRVTLTPLPRPSPTPVPVTTTTAAPLLVGSNCTCVQTWLRRRGCDSHCNMVACGFIEGPCHDTDGNALQAAQTSTPAPTHNPAASSDRSPAPAFGQGSGPAPGPNKEPVGFAAPGDVVDLNVVPHTQDGSGAWRIVASSQPDGRPSWYADSVAKDVSEEREALPLPVIIAIVSAALVLVAIVCLLARKRASIPSGNCQVQQGMHEAPWTPRGASVPPVKRQVSKGSTGSTRSAMSQETLQEDTFDNSSGSGGSWAWSPVSGHARGSSAGFTSAASRILEPKVHPEPEPNPDVRAEQGAWRPAAAQRRASRRATQVAAAAAMAATDARRNSVGTNRGAGAPRRRAQSEGSTSPTLRAAAAAFEERAGAGFEEVDSSRAYAAGVNARTRSESRHSRQESRGETQNPRNPSKRSAHCSAPSDATSHDSGRRSNNVQSNVASGRKRGSKDSTASWHDSWPNQKQKPHQSTERWTQPPQQPSPPPMPPGADPKSSASYQHHAPGPEQSGQTPQEEDKQRQQHQQQQKQHSWAPFFGAWGSIGQSTSSTHGRASSSQRAQRHHTEQKQHFHANQQCPSQQQQQQQPQPQQQQQQQQKQHQQRPRNSDTSRRAASSPPVGGSRTNRASKGPGPSAATGGGWGWSAPRFAKAKRQEAAVGPETSCSPKETDPTGHAEKLVQSVVQEMESTKGEPLEARKRIFRELQRRLHPDKNLEYPEAAKLAFQRLMENRGSYLLP